MRFPTVPWLGRRDRDEPRDEHLRALAWLSADQVLGPVPGRPDWRQPLADAIAHHEVQAEDDEPPSSC